MKPYIFAVIMFCVLVSAPLAGPTAWASDDSKVDIMRTGTFYNNEYDAKRGEKWFGLYDGDSGMFLKETAIKVKTVHEEFDIESNGPIDGVEVYVEQQVEPLFLVNGIKGMKAGPVSTCFFENEYRSIRPGDEEKIRCGTDDAYTLKASGNVGVNGNYENYSLRLEKGAISQELGHSEKCNETNPQLYWAGDLDGDGALDLYLNMSDDYLEAVYTLFLSTKAGDGELVGKAAEFVVYYY